MSDEPSSPLASPYELSRSGTLVRAIGAFLAPKRTSGVSERATHKRREDHDDVRKSFLRIHPDSDRILQSDRPKAVRIVDRSPNEIAALQTQLAKTTALLDQEKDKNSANHGQLESTQKQLKAQILLIRERDKTIAERDGELEETIDIAEEFYEASEEHLKEADSALKEIEQLKVGLLILNAVRWLTSSQRSKAQAERKAREQISELQAQRDTLAQHMTELQVKIGLL